jgi:hypothetical protein
VHSTEYLIGHLPALEQAIEPKKNANEETEHAGEIDAAAPENEREWKVAVHGKDAAEDRLSALQNEFGKEQAKKADSEGDEIAAAKWRRWEPELPFAFKHFRKILYRDHEDDKVPEDHS